MFTAFQRLANMLSHATPLQYISFRKCKIGNEGLISTYEALETLRRLKKIDYSDCCIFDKGLEGLYNFVGTSTNCIIDEIKFCENEITDIGFCRFFQAMDKGVNTIT